MNETYMQRRAQGHQTVFGKFLAVVTALEAAPGNTMSARDLVICYYGTSGDGNANYRDQTETVVQELHRAGLVTYTRARNRIADVTLLDTGALAGLEHDERVICSRQYAPDSLDNIREHREYQRQRASERKARQAA